MTQALSLTARPSDILVPRKCVGVNACTDGSAEPKPSGVNSKMVVFAATSTWPGSLWSATMMGSGASPALNLSVLATADSVTPGPPSLKRVSWIISARPQ